MRRRFCVIFRLCVGLCVLVAAATPLRAQSDYLAQSKHSPVHAKGWQPPSQPLSPQGRGGTQTTFDETRTLGEGRSAYEAAENDIAARGDATVGSGGNWMLNTITALGAVIGLILLIRAGYAKFTGRTLATMRHDVVQVMARVPVAPRNHVLILRVAGRVLVVGDGPGGMNTLAQIDDPEEVASLLKSLATSQSNSISQGFSQLMGRFNSAYSEDDATIDEGRDTREHVTDGARGEVSKLLAQLRSRRREVVG